MHHTRPTNVWIYTIYDDSVNVNIYLFMLQKYTLHEIRSYVDTVLDSTGSTSGASEVSFLPVNHVMQDGTDVVVRSMRTDESSLFRQKFGHGLGLYEWPTDKYFEKMVRGRGPVIIVEDRRTGTMVAGMIITTSAFSRGDSARLMDGYVAINPDYVGRGLGKEIVGIVRELSLELGFTAALTDAAVSNTGAVAAVLSDGFIMTGVIPKSIYKLDRGWTDAVLLFRKLSTKPSKKILTIDHNNPTLSKR